MHLFIFFFVTDSARKMRLVALSVAPFGYLSGSLNGFLWLPVWHSRWLSSIPSDSFLAYLLAPAGLSSTQHDRSPGKMGESCTSIHGWSSHYYSNPTYLTTDHTLRYFLQIHLQSMSCKFSRITDIVEELYTSSMLARLGFYAVSTLFQLFKGDSSQIHVSWTIFDQY